MGFQYQGVAHGSTGYNGQTGSPAKWDEGKGMWVDANGVQIRDDAITSTPPPVSSGGPAAPAPADAAPSPTTSSEPFGGAGAGGGGGNEFGSLSSMPASMSALAGGAAQDQGPSVQPMGNSLGRRIYPESMRILSQLGRAVY